MKRVESTEIFQTEQREEEDHYQIALSRVDAKRTYVADDDDVALAADKVDHVEAASTT